MLYEELNTTNGLYFVDYQLVNRIFHDSYYLQTLNNTAKRKTEDEGFLLPETYHVEVDYKIAKSHAAAAPKFAVAKSSPISPMRGSDIEIFRKRLYELERDGRKAKEQLQKKQQDASNDSMKNINKNIDYLEFGVMASKLLRDTSTEILLLSSCIISGGATALATGAAGSILQGIYKWQDTGNLGASTLQSVVSFATVLIPGPTDTMGKNAARMLIFTKAKTQFAGNFAVGIAEGNTISKSAISAGINVVAGQMIDKVIPGDQIQKSLNHSLKNIPIPVTLEYVQKGFIQTVAGKISPHEKTKLKMMKQTSSRKLDTVAISDPVLADMAIIGPDRSTPGRTWA